MRETGAPESFLLKKFEETKDELELLTSQWEAASVELEQRESELAEEP